MRYQVTPVRTAVMGGPWGHCAKWNKSKRERQILCDITYMCNLKKPNS